MKAKEAISQMIGRSVRFTAEAVNALDEALLALFSVHTKMHRMQNRADRIADKVASDVAERLAIEEGLAEFELSEALEIYHKKRWEFQVALNSLHNTAATLLNTPQIAKEEIEEEYREKLRKVDLAVTVD